MFLHAYLYTVFILSRPVVEKCALLTR